MVSDRSDSRYNSSNNSSNTSTSLDTTASSASLTSGDNITAVAIMEEAKEEKERQQIKEWHDSVFKDIKKYDCLSHEELNRFKLVDKKSD